MAASKSQVVSVRVGPDIKAALQSAAAREMRSLANMLEVMIVTYCREQGHPIEGIAPGTLAGSRSAGRAA